MVILEGEDDADGVWCAGENASRSEMMRWGGLREALSHVVVIDDT